MEGNGGRGGGGGGGGGGGAGIIRKGSVKSRQQDDDTLRTPATNSPPSLDNPRHFPNTNHTGQGMCFRCGHVDIKVSKEQMAPSQ